MGQYHSLFNLDKQEIVNPHGLGFGAKQVEHTGYEGSLSDVLYALCAFKDARGGGDLSDSDGVFKGRWHGDRVAVIGDYAEAGDLPEAWNSMRKDSAGDIDSGFMLSRFADITEEIKPYWEKTFNRQSLPISQG